MPVIHLIAAGATPAQVLATLDDCLNHAVRGWPVVLHASPEIWAQLGDAPALHTPGDVQVSGLRDGVLLRAGTRLPLGWDARLEAAAAAAPELDTVSPLSTADAVLRPDAIPAAFDVAELADFDRRMLDASQARIWPVWRASMHCVWVTAGRCPLPERFEAWPADVLQQAGGVHGTFDALLVAWDGPPLQMPRMPNAWQPWAAAADQTSPLRTLQPSSAPQWAWFFDGRPVQLHIMHSWGGGLERWVRDYCAAEAERVNLVLKSIGDPGVYGRRFALYASLDDARPLQIWDFSTPIRATDDTHPEYTAMLREIIVRYLVDAVFVSSLIGHTLDALRTGLPTLHVWHEYHPFCPALYIYHRQVCTRCEPTHLAECFAHNPLNHLFGTLMPAEWQSLRTAYLDTVRNASVKLVAPSRSVLHHYRQLAPVLADVPVAVIPHGMDWSAKSPPPERRKLRLVILGALAEQKGQSFFEALWPLIAPIADVVMLGCGEVGARYANRPGITVVPRYTREQLADLLVAHAPDAGLLMSVWPETFSYTLSELLCAGIPPIAPNHGGYLDRVVHGENGFLCPPDVQAFADQIFALDRDRALLDRARTALKDFRHRTLADMAADYRALLPLRPLASGFQLMPRRAPIEMPARPLPSVGGFPPSLREATYMAHGYLRQKIALSPRLRPWARRFVRGALELMMRVVYRILPK